MLPQPYSAVRPYAFTLWRTPPKFTGDLALPLLDTPIEAACAVFIISNELSTALYPSGFLPFPSTRCHHHPLGGRDDHQSGAGRFSGCVHLNCFFVSRKNQTLLRLNRWSNYQMIQPTPMHQSTVIGSWSSPWSYLQQTLQRQLHSKLYNNAGTVWVG